MLLEGQKPESFILDNRSTKRESIVLIAKRGLVGRCAGRKGAGIEKGGGLSKCGVAVEVVHRTVNLVASGFQNNVNNAAGIAPGFGIGLRLRAEFIDRIQRH